MAPIFLTFLVFPDKLFFVCLSGFEFRDNVPTISGKSQYAPRYFKYAFSHLQPITITHYIH